MQVLGLRVQDSGFRCVGLRVWGPGFGDYGLASRIHGLGFGCRVEGLGFRV